MIRTQPSRKKQVELAGSAGAGVLGMGVGALLVEWMAPYALLLLVVGVALHSWGMLEKYRLDRGVQVPLWSTALFWLCWILLAMLMIWINLKAFRA